MAANFNVQFIINDKTQTRVIRLTDTSTGYVLTKGLFSITFPDGSTRIKTDFNNPDITSPSGYVDILAVTDLNGVLTGQYKIDFVGMDESSNTYSSSKQFDFNFETPENGIVDRSDSVIPQVEFFDSQSYSPVGSFTGTATREFKTTMPSTSAVSGQVITSSTNTLTPVVSSNYYEGIYSVTNEVAVNYTHSSYSWLTISFVGYYSATFDVRQAPTQLVLIEKIDVYRSYIDALKTKNQSQFEILSEEYDLLIALYTHLVSRYSFGLLDGSESILKELLSIVEPYTTHNYKSTPMTPFDLASSSGFSISDGTNTDLISLGQTLSFLSSSGALSFLVGTNSVTITPTFGTSANTFAQGNDARFHNAVTLGSANGLSLINQQLSLAAATSNSAGAMTATDKVKIDAIPDPSTIGSVKSVGLSMPPAFTVANSPVTSSGVLAVSAAGTALQYIKGDGTLATLNTGVVPENGSLYFTNARARGAISVSGSLSYNSSTGVISYTTPAETDPIFSASAAFGITATNISNWNTAYGWGNHASAGYLLSSTAASTYQPLDDDLIAISGLTGTVGLLKKTAANTWALDTTSYLSSETDPVFTASPSFNITNTNISNWNTAYGWGNHASAGYLLSSTAASTYQPLDINLTVISGLSGTSGLLRKTGANTWELDTTVYLSSETDPVYTASSWYSTTNNSSNWNTAYSWGNHALAGYLTTISGITAGGELSGTYPNPTLANSAVISKVLTGLNITGSAISATDSILQAFGKLQNQINGLVGSVIYQGTWNASTNTPTLTSGSGTKGYYYKVSVEGTTSLDGISDWKAGDWAIYNGTAWEKVDNTDSVSSVNGFTGTVSLTTSNITEGTNLYYTNSRARGSLSFVAGSGDYNSTTGVITIPTNTNQLTNGAGFITGITSGMVTTALGYTPVTNARTLTINGTTYDLSADRSWTISAGSSSLSLLTDVSLVSVANGQLLQYSSASSKWVNWTPNYLTANQNITISGDASGSGSTAITLTLANSGVTAGSYGSASAIPVITVDSKGRVTAVSTQAVSIVSTLSGLSDVNITSASSGQLLQYNSTSGKWINWTPNYLTSYTETDPIFVASAAYGITSTNISNWNTAYGWGNHASAGYLLSSTAASTYLPLSGGTLTNSLTFSSATGYNPLRITGGVADYYPAVQDGAGRVNWYWNKSGTGGSPTFQVSSEDAVRLKFNTAQAAGAESGIGVYYAPASTAGAAITWTEIMGAFHNGFRVLPAATFSSSVTASSFVKSGGTSSQFLKADGSVDSTAYYPNSNPNGYTSNTGTVTSVSGTGSVSGLTLTGTVTTSGSLTLGGSLTLTSGQVTTALGYTPVNGSIASNGMSYVTHDFNSYPNLYSATFINASGSTNVPAAIGANMSYRFVMGAGDTTSRGFDLLGFPSGLLMRERSIGTWWTVLHSSNYNSYSPTLTGGGASGTWGISVTGNAGTATTLQTARTITIGSTGKTFNGSANVSWTLAEIGAQAAGSYLTAESDTLATVTGRGASTSTNLTFNGTLSFGSATRQMLNLWGTQYGIGIQSSTLYFRSDSRFSWHVGGSHNDAENNAGGGTNVLTLTSGSLTLGSNAVLHAGNYNSYSPTLTGGGASGTWGVNVTGSAGSVAWGNVSSKPSHIMYYQGFTLDANTMDVNSTGFTYQVNAPYVGPIVRFSAGGSYDLWLTAPYSGGGTGLAFRTRNGDTATLNPWRIILNDANYTSYSPSLTGSGASGTWGISISGNAASASSVAWTNVSGRPTALSSFTNDTNYITSASVGNGTLTMNVSGTGLSGSATFTANQSGATTFTVTSNATSANTASTIVARDASGNFTAGSVTVTLLTETSSIRYKENIITLQDSLEKVIKMRGVSYNRKGTNNVEIGVIAEEINEILPNAIVKDEKGRIDSVQYSRLTAVLIEAVKEQQKQINELKELINNKQ